MRMSAPIKAGSARRSVRCACAAGRSGVCRRAKALLDPNGFLLTAPSGPSSARRKTRNR